MSAESTCALLCLNNWGKQGFIKQEDLKVAAVLPGVNDGEKEDDFGMVVVTQLTRHRSCGSRNVQITIYKPYETSSSVVSLLSLYY
jgi:hypothetical protein